MKFSNVAFTLVDSQILESYQQMLPGLADYLGPGCEIVLHSLEDLEHSVVAICNGERTGRQVGAPITDLALQMLAQIQESPTRDSVIYFNRTGAQEAFRSTTIVIRGERGRAIGLLCINFDLYQPLQPFLQLLAGQQPAPDGGPVEVHAKQSDDLIASAVDAVRAEVCADGAIPASGRNREIIRRLYGKGIFNLKSAVYVIAELLGISRNTVYLHLRNAEKPQ